MSQLVLELLTIGCSDFPTVDFPTAGRKTSTLMIAALFFLDFAQPLLFCSSKKAQRVCCLTIFGWSFSVHLQHCSQPSVYSEYVHRFLSTLPYKSIFPMLQSRNSSCSLPTLKFASLQYFVQAPVFCARLGNYSQGRAGKTLGLKAQKKR